MVGGFKTKPKATLAGLPFWGCGWTFPPPRDEGRGPGRDEVPATPGWAHSRKVNHLSPSKPLETKTNESH